MLEEFDAQALRAAEWLLLWHIVGLLPPAAMTLHHL
jgi:hypothetical protein